MQSRKNRTSKKFRRGVKWLRQNIPDWVERLPEDVTLEDMWCFPIVYFAPPKYNWEGSIIYLGLKDLEPLGFFVPGDQRSRPALAEYRRLNHLFWSQWKVEKKNIVPKKPFSDRLLDWAVERTKESLRPLNRLTRLSFCR